MRIVLVGLLFLTHFQIKGQTVVNVYPDTLVELVNVNYKPGVFYVPKTDAGVADFTSNHIYQNSIRTHVIETVLNSTENLTDCLALLESVEPALVELSSKCKKFVFIFEKMPAWLSSSDNGSPAMTPGWFVLNTKKPASWTEWQAMVEAITDKIVNDFGIENAYFEVWNEPDIGSWTESKADYLELYKRTYDGVKAAGSDIQVGGPAVNFWANNIYWKPIAGYIPTVVADSSLISDLLVYGLAESRIPDFVSWHNFSLNYQEFAFATNYVNDKCVALGIPSVEVMLSEWNVPSVIRDTPLAKSFMIKAQLEISATAITTNMIAAWQDFSFDTEEFHHDYGLITYGSIHKPAYNAIKLTNELEGAICKITCADRNVSVASAFSDTLYLIISNYCPPALQEAVTQTLFEGEFNLNDLEAAGFIDIAEADFTNLIEVYEGETVIPDSSPLNIAINEAIETYQFYDSVAVYPRTYNINLQDYTEDYLSARYLVGDEKNNMQFRYDSLILAGFTQETAAEFIRENHQLVKEAYTFSSGTGSITLAPNEVVLFKVGISGVGGEKENQKNSILSIYPNPASNELTIRSSLPNETYFIYNLMGELVKKVASNGSSTDVDIIELAKGVYVLQDGRGEVSGVKFVKE
ncbi:MAG: T9SS type A sorting domain-containing protein [Crocinitomix sp.]|nr:T9SS type A sorting domain-containing protein [Crocinitomix sp.]